MNNILARDGQSRNAVVELSSLVDNPPDDTSVGEIAQRNEKKDCDQNDVDSQDQTTAIGCDYTVYCSEIVIKHTFAYFTDRNNCFTGVNEGYQGFPVFHGYIN